jgi:uncharacterized protein (TIGR02147 family)
LKKSIYEFQDYKIYLNHWVSKQPKAGHGEYRRIAKDLGVSTTMISQVFKSDKHLSLEMGAELCDYLNLSEDESEYLLLLLEFQKAGSYKLQQRLKKQILKRQDRAQKLENRLRKDADLSEENKAVFYSSWIYSAVRLLSDISTYNDSLEIAKRLNLDKNLVEKVIDFLLDQKLCTRQGGKLKMGPTSTHIGTSSLLLSKHHQNWRLQGFNKMILNDNNNLFFTGPLVLSKELADEIRMQLPNFIQETIAKVHSSKSEVVRCFNIDWYEY